MEGDTTIKARLRKGSKRMEGRGYRERQRYGDKERNEGKWREKERERERYIY